MSGSRHCSSSFGAHSGDVSSVVDSSFRDSWATALGRRCLLLALAVVGLAGCAVSPRAEILSSRERLYTNCQLMPSGDRCADLGERFSDYLTMDAPSRNEAFLEGQAIFALTRSGRLGDARSVAAGCAVEGWWCWMLQGHVHAEARETVEAQDDFNRALSEMPEDVLCAWLDLSPLLPGATHDRFDSPECAIKRELNEVVWWLADPSYLVPGNGAEVEHMNRMAVATLHDDHLLGRRGWVDDGVGHATGHHVAVVQRGMSKLRFDRAWRNDRRPVYDLIPSAEALLDPLQAPADAWDLEPGAVYHPVNLGRLTAIPAQVAFFERGDSVLATAATDLSEVPILANGADRGAGLILSQGPDGPFHTASTLEVRDRYVFRLAAPRGRYLVSVEAQSGAGLGRIRFGHGLPHPAEAPVRLSDLLLYAPDERIGVESLEEAQPRMRGSTQWSANEVVGLYLEVYGADDPSAYEVAVALSPEDRGGLLGAIGRVFGGGPGEPVEVRWRRRPDEDLSVLAFTIDLADIDPGRYVIEVTIGSDGPDPVAVSRRIEVIGN